MGLAKALLDLTPRDLRSCSGPSILQVRIAIPIHVGSSLHLVPLQAVVADTKEALVRQLHLYRSCLVTRVHGEVRLAHQLDAWLREAQLRQADVQLLVGLREVRGIFRS